MTLREKVATELDRWFGSVVITKKADTFAEADAIFALFAEDRAALVEYCRHETACPLAQWSQGRPTKDGGYETMYAGRWYRGDDKPACTCGLAAALAGKGETK